MRRTRPSAGLYLADLGFFALWRLCRLAKRRTDGKRFFVMRLHSGTGLYTRGGHQVELRGLLPQEEGEAKEMGVLVGKQAQLPVRLIMVRVCEEVAKLRRKRIHEAAQAHGRQPCEEVLYLAGWTIVLTNVACARLSLPEALVRLAAPLADRTALALMERRWTDRRVARAANPWRILCELYGKLAAMLIQQWLIHEG